MTPDLDAIRAALAAEPDWGQTVPRTWLAALCDEIERLRSMYEIDEKHIVRVAAERDAALARIAELEALDYVRNVDAEKERDAALAEVERLRALYDEDAVLWTKAEAERDAWRACADQLFLAMHQSTPIAQAKEALAVYERLKGADS